LEGERELELFFGAAGVFGVAMESGPVGGAGEKQEEKN